MDPKVSVIIPVYNVERYLEEGMESVVGQTLQDIEIICINDGSTDHSLEILKRYAEADPRIVLIDKQNEGYGVGMNIGLDRAAGEYIGIVEPDDFVPADMFEELYAAADENRLDFIKADFFRFVTGPDGQYRKTLYRLSSDPDDYNRVFDPSSDPSRLRYVMNTWCGIYRREFLNSHHIRHNTTPGASFQDTGFWLQTFIYARRAMITGIPYYMNRRDNPGSSVHDPNKVFVMNREFEFIRNILEKDPEIRQRFIPMYWYIKYQAYLPRLRRIAQKYKIPFVKKMREEFLQADRDGELDPGLFSVGERKVLETLLKDPYLFLFREEGLRIKLHIREKAISFLHRAPDS